MASEIEYCANIGQEQMEILCEESKKIHFSTNLPFLSAHKGWRRGNLHIFLGTSHGGKSTLLRTCLVDALSSNSGKTRVGLVLSEESKLDFLTEFNHSGKMGEILDRLFIVSEQDHPEKFSNAKDWFHQVKKMCDLGQIDILFFDNLTTAAMYEGATINDQKTICLGLKRMATTLNIPVVIVAHTGANITDSANGLIEMNDIRYSKMIVNLAQFFYIMQTFKQEDGRYTTLRITKHRGQEVKSTMFQLFYYSSVRLFMEAERIAFSKIKELFKNRNKL